MRIAFVSYEYFGLAKGGGIGTYVRYAAAALADYGHSVAVFTSANHTRDTQLNNGVEVYPVSATRPDFARSILPVFARHHESKPFDVIEGPEYGADASAIAHAFPELPLVVRLHTPSFVIDEINALYISGYSKARFVLGGLRRGTISKPYWKYQREFDAERAHTLLADEITAPSNAILELLRERWRLPEQQLRKVPHIFVPAKTLLEISTSARSNCVTFFGRLEVRKGVIELAQAIPLVLKQMPLAKFRFIGRSLPHPDTGEDLRTFLARTLATYRASVEFIDAVPHGKIPSVLSSSDICVFPSVWEASGYVCKEAMAAARGVIGSNAGGMAEIIDHGRTGLLVPPRDCQALAAAILKLLRDPDRRIAMGQAARAHVSAAFAPEVIVPLQEASYVRAIERVHHCRARSKGLVV